MQAELGLNDLPTTKSVFRHYLGPVGAWCGAFGLFILLGSVIVVFYCLLVKYLFGFFVTSISIYEASQNLSQSFNLSYERDLVWTGWSVNTSVPFYCLLMIIPFCLPPKIMKYFYMLQPIGLLNIAIMIAVILYSGKGSFSINLQLARFLVILTRNKPPIQKLPHRPQKDLTAKYGTSRRPSSVSWVQVFSCRTE